MDDATHREHMQPERDTTDRHAAAGETVRFAGIGCRRDCPVSAIRELLTDALAECGLTAGDLAGLASVETKGGEPALRASAEELGLSLSLWPAAVLRQFEDRVEVLSSHARSATGTGSVAEASALAAASCGDPADRHAVLALTRRSNGSATIAIACRPDGAPTSKRDG